MVSDIFEVENYFQNHLFKITQSQRSSVKKFGFEN